MSDSRDRWGQYGEWDDEWADGEWSTTAQHRRRNVLPTVLFSLGFLFLVAALVTALNSGDGQRVAELTPNRATGAAVATPAQAVATPTPTPAPPTPTATPTPEAPPLPAGVPEDVQVAIVEEIVDGDTIWVQPIGPGPLEWNATHNIRLLQIETPETRQGTECWGPESTVFAEEGIPVGSTVYLQADEEDTDQYGRFLRYVWTEEGKFFNAEAVVNGHAAAVLYEPNDRHIDAMRVAEAKAQDAERGMWGDPCDYDDTLVQQKSPAPPPAPEPAQEDPDPAPAGNCDPGYDPCVPPHPPDLDCGDLNGPYTITGSDPHRLDREGDGIGCESG